MMVAAGLFTRRNGEQVLVHECLGCGIRRHNRVAADDNIVATMRVPIVEQPGLPEHHDELTEEETA
jgi:hypothetical protein